MASRSPDDNGWPEKLRSAVEQRDQCARDKLEAEKRLERACGVVDGILLGLGLTVEEAQRVLNQTKVVE